MYQFSETRQPHVDERNMAGDLVCYTSRSFYLTGKPCTGKTSFLQQVAAESGKKFIFLSPLREVTSTSSAADINTFFQLPAVPFIWESFTDDQKHIFYHYSKEKRQLIEQAELIIIDDIASVRADTIDAIDFRLRNFGGKKNLPFGGKQVVFAGDTFQLADLVKEADWELLKKTYDTPYFFSARALLKTDLLVVEFKQTQGEQDEKCTSLLNKIRRKQLQQHDIDLINSRYLPDFSPLEEDDFVEVVTERSAADEINQQRLNQLPGELYAYEAGLQDGTQGEPGNELMLKQNAQVIFVNDDADGRWKKGTVGKVTALSPDSITVSFTEAGNLIQLEPERITRQNFLYQSGELAGGIGNKVCGCFTQFPVKLGWAVSLDECSGIGLNKVITDVSGAKTGAVYTALSRCKTLEGLHLRSPLNNTGILVRDEVVRLSLSANNERLIKDAIANGRADMFYRKCAQAFEQGAFEQAITDLTQAIALRNDTAVPSFKRLMAMKLNTLKNKKQQTIMPVQNFVWAEEQKQKAMSAGIQVPESAEITMDIDPTLKQLATERHTAEQMSEQPDFDGTEVGIAEPELVITRTNFEESLPVFHSNGHDDSSVLKQLEEKINSLSGELQQQKEETGRLKESMKALSDSENNRNFESKRSVRYWAELTDHVSDLELDVARWKKIVVVGGTIFCLIITILLFVVFNV